MKRRTYEQLTKKQYPYAQVLPESVEGRYCAVRKCPSTRQEICTRGTADDFRTWRIQLFENHEAAEAWVRKPHHCNGIPKDHWVTELDRIKTAAEFCGFEKRYDLPWVMYKVPVEQLEKDAQAVLAWLAATPEATFEQFCEQELRSMALHYLFYTGRLTVEWLGLNEQVLLTAVLPEGEQKVDES